MYLDLTCPVASKAPTSTWPHDWSQANSESISPQQLSSVDNAKFARRRYLETLFLPDILAPLASFTTDLLNVQPESIAPILLSLSEIEHRHRKVLGPIIHTIIVDAKDQEPETGLSEDEYQVIYTATRLRLECRAVVEGNSKVLPRKIVEELERREILIQIILLLVYPSIPKKRKSTSETSPKDDPKAALELLFDRLSVWQAIAELGTDDSMGAMLRGFWDNIILKFFIHARPELSELHMKLFNRPYEQPTKKPRKPKVTQARPVPINQPEPMRRSVSTSDRPRSRSHSTEPSTIVTRKLVRAPSAKDLLKGREVGFIRRSVSAILRKEASQPKSGLLGLLGRKTSEPKPQTFQTFSTTNNQTLVLATPSKPKPGPFRFAQPTPIQEEPYRPTWVEETPRGDHSITEFDDDDGLSDLMVMTDEEDEEGMA